MQEERTSLGCIIVVVGFMMINEDLLRELGAPLENENIHHWYHVTTSGDLVCYNQLCSFLTQDEDVVCTLINQHDWGMEMKVIERMKAEHLKKNSEGNVDFNSIEVPHYEGHARLPYFPKDVTFKLFSNEIRTMRKDHKLMMQIPF